MKHKIRPRLHRRPHRRRRLIPRLRVRDAGGGEVAAGTVGQLVIPRHLPPGKHRQIVFRRAKAGSAAFHINVGKERAIHGRAAGVNHLGKADAKEGFGVELGDGSSHCAGTHRPSNDERGKKARLPGFGIGVDNAKHAVVVAQRAGGVDGHDHAGVFTDGLLAKDNFAHCNGVAGVVDVGDAAHESFVAVGDERQQHVKVAFAVVQVVGFAQNTAGKVDVVGHLAKFGKVVEVGHGADAPAALVIANEGWPVNGGEHAVVAADGQMVGRVTRLHGEGAGCLADKVHEGVFINPHALPFNFGSVLAEDFQGGWVIYDEHPHVAEEAHGGAVDGLHALFADDFDEGEGVEQGVNGRYRPILLFIPPPGRTNTCTHGKRSPLGNRFSTYDMTIAHNAKGLSPPLFRR